ncbi:MAG: sodium/glutamate symporter, partial [Terrimicrobiaceae bacterium]|nr:sodium/glutamate symporter [Terrimicrobiaceae bacterium]
PGASAGGGGGGGRGRAAAMPLDSFTTLNASILVLALGKWLTRRLAPLRDFNIPEPVTGGLLAAAAMLAAHLALGVSISFDLAARDFLLLYFFSAIGLNSDVATLRAGGKPLVALVAATVVFLILQNLAGTGAAAVLGLDPLIGLLAGSVSLIGGHGTTIAWAPVFEESHGVAHAAEIGAASATLGLVLASLMGGPVARILIARHSLRPAEHGPLDIGASHEKRQESLDYFDILRALFWLNMSMAAGEALEAALGAAGIRLPLFVCCLFAAIFLTNTVPRVFRCRWPARSPALALVSDIALGVFLAMSLMSLQLWTLASLALPMLGILAAQFALAFGFSLLVVFRLMGSNYEAAVMSAGFGGISLGATPTAIANMTAVAQRYGAAHRAFIVVPLVSGFFVDIANALVIQKFLGWLG